MATNRTLPLFNLKAVITETGIKADTLRAWERRYGIPAPTRTASGHRLYSQADMDLLHWLVARQSEGLSIRRATEMWRSAAQEDQASGRLPPELLRAAPAARSAAPLPRSAVAYNSTVGAVRADWVDACLRYDEAQAEHALAHAFSLFTPEMVCLEVIQKGLATIGEGWYQGSVTVQQEHFASSLALRRLEAMLVAAPAPARPGRILIGCPPDEEHTFVPLLLSLLLRRRGWETIYLGANVPVRSLEATVAATHPQLVVLTAQQLTTVRGLLEMGEVLLHQQIALAYGGRIFNRIPQVRDAIPGHFLGGSLEIGLGTIEDIMTMPRVQRAQRPPAPVYRASLADFMRLRPHVESIVAQQIPAHRVPPRLLAAASHHFGCNVEAALALGNMEYAGIDMAWIEGLLVNHVGMTSEHVREYLRIYLEASRSALGGRAAHFADWLQRLLDPAMAQTASRRDAG